MADYNRYLEVDPQNTGILDGRGHAEMGLGQTINAISDFTNTIELQKGSDSAEYETRADAYLKSKQWDLAIKDLTAAISLEFGNQVLLMSIDQFRALYPEYKVASDDAIAHKLNKTFFPNIKYEDFAKQFLRSNGGWALDPSLFLQRKDAYMSAGDWHNAALDFRRAEGAAPESSKSMDVERWGEIAPSQSEQVYIDLKTYDDAHPDSSKVWIKQVPGFGNAPGTYSLRQFELSCEKRRIRVISGADYDASGGPTSNYEGGNWQSVVPETLGEIIFDGVCRVD
jgi:tetratricopeptide (TPR) repeat protein